MSEPIVPDPVARVVAPVMPGPGDHRLIVPNPVEASAGWRSLPSAERRRAWAAASRGVAPDDPALAALMVGYADTQMGRAFAYRLLGILVGVVLFCVLLGTVAFGLPAFIAEPLGVVLVLGCWLAPYLLIWRLRSLRNAGQLGLEAARWQTAHGSAAHGLGHNHPTFSVAPTIGANGATELAASRSLAIRSLVLVGLVVAVLVAALVDALDDPIHDGDFWLNDVGCPALVLALLLLFLLVRQPWRDLTQPVLARLTAHGFELPRLRYSAPWTELTGVDVRVRNSLLGGLTSLLPRTAGTHLLVLHVTDPERALASGGRHGRRLRRDGRRYGSPLVLRITPWMSLTTEQLLGTLVHHHKAPIRWR